MDELQKIDLYLDEVRSRWDQNAELAISRDFFLLWQELHEPMPFAIPDGQDVQIQGTVLDVVSDTARVGFCTWDSEACCPVLNVEGETSRQQILLLVQDGEPVIEEQAPVFDKEDDVSYGERLEVIFDVIHHVRRHRPETDIRTLRGRVFNEALSAVAEHHPPRVMSVMRRLRSASRDRLFERALADFAVDEMSNQLELPLDGSFAASETQQPPEPTRRQQTAPSRGNDTGGTYRIPGRTVWETSLDLAYLEQSYRSQAAHRREIVLPLDKATVVDDSRPGVLTVNVELSEDEEGVIEAGDLLKVIRGGGGSVVANLRVDLIEKGAFYGRLKWANATDPYPLDRSLVALLPLGPEEALASGLAAMKQLVNERAEENPLGAAGHALGFVETNLVLGTTEAPAHFDPSQERCFQAAVEESNRIVLIQGPPGTGKTCVLEYVLRELCARGKCILIAAPSNAAVDNICRRLDGLPVLRTSYSRRAVAPDVAETSWFQDEEVCRRVRQIQRSTGALIIAGTQVGVLRCNMVQEHLETNGLFDAMILDEAGMARAGEMLLTMGMARRAVFFGDPMQLPPHPLERSVLEHIEEQMGIRLHSQRRLITRSGMEWLTSSRGFPLLPMTQSYRCQNPRLMRFASTLFYDARVRAHGGAEYFALPFHERRSRYSGETLRLYTTSRLPQSLRQERLVVEGQRPGIENRVEAAVVMHLVTEYLRKYPPEEITVITPYRRQVRLIRRLLLIKTAKTADAVGIPREEWREWVHNRVSTVDSFQGGESDVVIISYARSNSGRGIGFTSDPNRVNVTHTRARREMVVVADSECLVRECAEDTFRRMVHAFERDGDIVTVTEAWLHRVGTLPERDFLENHTVVRGMA